MIRFSTIIWLILVATTGYAMFQVKYQVSQLDERLAHINRQIADDQEATHVLKAEWAFLNQPKRLEDLNQRYLSFVPIGTKTLSNLEAQPMRPVPGAEPGAETVSTTTTMPAVPPMKPMVAPMRARTQIAHVAFKVQR